VCRVFGGGGGRCLLEGTDQSYSRVLTVIKFSLHFISFNKSLVLERCIDTPSPTSSV
jgi:hypothetical protein